MSTGQDDLGKKNIGELFQMLRPGQLWSIGVAIIALGGGLFWLGSFTEKVFNPCLENERTVENNVIPTNSPQISVPDQSFEITVSALKSSIIGPLGGISVKLNNSGEHNDELLFDGIIGRAESPTGPFVSDEERGGTKYWDGQQFYIQLRTKAIWRVTVTSPTEHTIDLVFVSESTKS